MTVVRVAQLQHDLFQVGHDSHWYVTQLTFIPDMTHFHMWHDLSIAVCLSCAAATPSVSYVTGLPFIYDITQIHMRYDSRSFVTWLIDNGLSEWRSCNTIGFICDINQIHMWHNSNSYETGLTFIRVTWSMPKASCARCAAAALSVSYVTQLTFIHGRRRSIHTRMIVSFIGLFCKRDLCF